MKLNLANCMVQELNRPKTILNLVEFILVLILGFGLFWYSSYLALSKLSIEEHNYSTELFIELAITEVILFGLIILILKWRNWGIQDFNLQFTFPMLGVGLLLVILRLGIGRIIEFAFGISFPTEDYQLSANLISIILVLIINSIFEEFLLLGYLFKRLKSLNPGLVIIISMVIRESYHVYQGWEKLPMAISIGLVFGWYYYTYKKLWPPIIAHALGNGLAFLALYYGWSWL